MEAIHIKIDTGNAAFGDDDPHQRGAEVARILRNLAERLERDGLSADTFYNLRDFNGNTVGHAGQEKKK